MRPSPLPRLGWRAQIIVGCAAGVLPALAGIGIAGSWPSPAVIAAAAISALLLAICVARLTMRGVEVRLADALRLAAAQHGEQAQELRRVNRALQVLSRCNATLVQAHDERALVNDICQHVVDIGGYRLAWVGYAQRDASCGIEPVAHAGSDRDYVDGLGLTWGDDASRRGVGGTAVRSGCTAVARHIASDPVFAHWRESALARGLASCIALPLRDKQQAFGTLSIYSAEADAFDAGEIKVLQELADDLAYGIASRRDANEADRLKRELEQHVHFDILTGLANRFSIEKRLAEALSDARRHDSHLTLMSIGLDRFKAVNDSLGHAVGDLLLIEVAGRLRGVVRSSDPIARLGGDQFIVMLKDLSAGSDAAIVAGKVLAALAAPLQLGAHELRTSASIGLSIFPDDGEDAVTLMKHADTAMNHAKTLGGASYRFFATAMNARLAARFSMEAELRRGIERGEMLMHYQPQVDLAGDTINGAEALLRWRHPDKGMVPPGDFIPLAEETGLIEALGEWVLASVCRQLRAWIDAGLRVPPVSVNLSARQFRQLDLVSRVERALADHALEPCMLSFEITESTMMHDLDAAVATATQLKALGVGLSLDDFGTGYSSLGYLKRFPLDYLKIDRSFVRDVATDADGATICNAVIGLAHSLHLGVIAEGVETVAQLQHLRKQRCDAVQGYLFSKPVPADEFAKLLSRQSEARIVVEC